jgi:hypothetical protein
MKPLFIQAEEQNVLVHQITETLIRRFFISGKKYITGPELLHFCENPQVNRFIFFQLHQEWNKYQAGLRHPAYNFDHEEVKKAMQTYLNILSAHILMTETQFRVYVEKAVFNTLSLLLNPEDTFSGFYFSTKEGINLSILEKNVSYFHYFDFILQGIILYHQQNTMPLVRKRIFMEKFIKAEEIAVKKGRSLEAYRRDMFRKLTGKDLFEIARTADGSIPIAELASGSERQSASPIPFRPIDEISETPLPIEEAQVEEESSDIESQASEIQEAIAAEIAAMEVSELDKKTIQQAYDAEQKAIEVAAEAFADSNTPEIPLVAQPPAPAETPIIGNDTLEPETPARAESPQTPQDSEKKKTLADLFQQNNSAQYKSAKPMDLDTIPIHKQFQFSQKIFKGNSVLFREFIQALSKTQDQKEVQALLQNMVIIPHQVNETDELYQEFYGLVMQPYQS